MNYKKENGWNCVDSKDQVFKFSEGYKEFLSSAKSGQRSWPEPPGSSLPGP